MDTGMAILADPACLPRMFPASSSLMGYSLRSWDSGSYQHAQ